MSYYWFNKKELLQKAKEKYDNSGKEKAAKYYQANKNVLKEKVSDKYKNLSEIEKEAKKDYSKNRYKEMKKMQIYFYSIKMTEQILKFGDIAVNKK